MADVQTPSETETDEQPEPQADPADARQPAWWRVSKRVLGYSLLLFFAFIFIFPFMLAIITSFKTQPEATQAPLDLIPSPATMRAWAEEIFGSGQVNFPRWTFNSFFITFIVTVGRILLDSMAGYALARLKFPGRQIVFAVIVSTLAIPAIVLAIPRFIVLGTLGMLNSYSGMAVPLAVDAFGIFLMKQFFESIPREMEEAAKVDGATVFQTFWRVVLPLAAPGLIALTILSFQGAWNEFLHYLIAAPADQSLRTLTVGLALLRGSQGQGLDFPVLMGASILTTVPVAIIFFVFQRYFIQGVAATGVKG
ncbi:MAG: carbohydrate ABC transporter permease [Egibacteraceae bacterium]